MTMMNHFPKEFNISNKNKNSNNKIKQIKKMKKI